MDDGAHIAALVRDRDRDRYLADLFIAPALRPHLLALHAFNAEIVRIREAVSDPVLGEIRQEWWRETLAGERQGEGHPVAAAVLTTIQTFNLPLAAFQGLIEARAFDLYNDPMPDVPAFEAYAGETSSALFQLAALILNGGTDPRSADAAGHAGVAGTLVECLLRWPTDARRRQLFLPNTVLAARGITPESLYDTPTLAGVTATMADLREMAHQHLVKAKSAAAALPVAVRPAFLPLALVEADLRRLDGGASNPSAPLREMAQWRRQWVLWRAARQIGT